MMAALYDWLLLLCGFVFMLLIVWAAGNWSSEGK
jgi:hypothetical protein